MYAVNGILFNHESPLRGETFVTRKITRGVAKIALGLQDKIYLGNLDAQRDWGHAKDYVEGMWLMMQQEKPEDFVIATGVQHSVKDFVSIAARMALGSELRWEGAGIDTKGYLAQRPAANGIDPNQPVVVVDPRYFRPTEVESLLGDASRARVQLGWTPKTSFEDLVQEMVHEDLLSARRDEVVKNHGYKPMDFHE